MKKTTMQRLAAIGQALRKEVRKAQAGLDKLTIDAGQTAMLAIGTHNQVKAMHEENQFRDEVLSLVAKDAAGIPLTDEEQEALANLFKTPELGEDDGQQDEESTDDERAAAGPVPGGPAEPDGGADTGEPSPDA